MTIVRNDFFIDRLLRDPKGPVGKTAKQLGLQVSNTAKSLCPVDTGRLRSSIQASSPFPSETGVTVRVGSRVKYARYVHDGTRNRDGSQRTKPRPFLKTALERVIR